MARDGKNNEAKQQLKAARSAKRAKRKERRGQLKSAFTMARENDRLFLPLLIAVPLAVLVLFVILGLILGSLPLFILLGVVGAAAGGSLVFGRRAAAAAYGQIEGQPGAAAAVLQGMRGNWRVTPAVAFTRNQDLVHRVIGRPGVVLVGEGSPHRVGQLLVQEKKKIARIAADTPVYDVVVGDEPGQVTLRRLQQHINKLPRNIKPAAVNALENRMRALGGANIPIPKGPLPRSARMPKGARGR